MSHKLPMEIKFPKVGGRCYVRYRTNPTVPMLFNESRDFPLSFLDLDCPQNREDVMNDHRCPKCKKLMMAMTDRTGKTQLRCVKCDKVDPMKTDAVKWANSGLSGPTNAP